MHRCKFLYSRYFNKVLVANRGEIACRVMNTCKRLDIPTVAIYSTADAKSKHVRLADEAFCVGPPASAESYLRIDKILDVIKQTGADAVHPGYGFLSENSDFSGALKSNGITFIGPKETAIQAMGDKIESKRLAKSLGVNTIPGYDGEVESEEQLLSLVKEIGYPVMIKASAGGGGKGMRVAHNDKELVEGFRLCKTEAMASFGDDRMLVEKFIEEPRHIEIQVIADQCGNTLYLPERECSIQRRNQKVIEEAPSTFIDPATRQAMGEQAVMLAKGVEYHTAGTVEMMVDKHRNFYFLEMNTRLQVEHPITEMITGVDLVEEMIRAAAGVPLSIRQEDVQINGWATESRVYSEDPINNFLPVIGRLTRYEEPVVVDGVRVDSGILEGSEISVYYDPLISKLCTWGPTRDVSLSRMATALDSYVIKGLKTTNINFLRDLMTHPKYVSGNITTKFIEEEYPEGYTGHTLTETERKELLCVTAVAHTLLEMSSSSPNSKRSGRNPQHLAKRWVAEEGAHNYLVDVRSTAEGSHFNVADECPSDVFLNFEINLQHIEKDLPFDHPLQTDLLTSLKDGASYPGHQKPFQNDQPFDAKDNTGEAFSLKLQWNLTEQLLNYTLTMPSGDVKGITQLLESEAFKHTMQYMGSRYTVAVMSPLQYSMSAYMLPPPVVDLTKELRSPMPGVVKEYFVKEGDKVEAGQNLVVLEAMKMRNVLSAQSKGVVKEIPVEVGSSVEDGEALVFFE